MQRFFTFIVGLLSGALMGVLTALLLAPTSGEQLRSKAKEQLEVRMEDIRTAIEGERSRLEAELETLKRGEIKIA